MGRSTLSELEWAGKDVPQMWASAQAADTQTAWQQVNAWRQTRDLLLHHASRLKACSDELTNTWPPERSRAAQAFINYINELHTAIMAASTGAATNHVALAEVLTSLSAAKTDMAKLQQDWERYEAAPLIGKAGTVSELDGTDPREALNTKARARMAQNDREVFDSSRRFVEMSSPQEQPYWERVPVGDDPRAGGSSGGSQGTRIPGDATGSRIDPPIVSSAGTIDGQLGLAGSAMAPKSPGVQETLTPGRASETLPAANAPIQAPGVGAVGGGRASRSSSVGEAGRLQRPSNFHSGPSGSVGATAPFSPLAVGAGRGQGKVNPVGGVIEPGRATSSASPVPLMGGARGHAGSDQDSAATPTMEWEVDVGVCPIIEPLPERPFQLGHGVIGIDR